MVHFFHGSFWVVLALPHVPTKCLITSYLPRVVLAVGIGKIWLSRSTTHEHGLGTSISTLNPSSDSEKLSYSIKDSGTLQYLISFWIMKCIHGDVSCISLYWSVIMHYHRERWIIHLHFGYRNMYMLNQQCFSICIFSFLWKTAVKITA